MEITTDDVLRWKEQVVKEICTTCGMRAWRCECCLDCEVYGSKCHCQYEEVTNDVNDQ